MSDLEMYKEKYKKIWEEYKNLDPLLAEKLFLKHVRALERVNKIKHKLETVSERERKREARALIILAKIVLRENKDLARNILLNYANEFKGKEGKVELDYSKYIAKFINKEEDKNETIKESTP